MEGVTESNTRHEVTDDDLYIRLALRGGGDECRSGVSLLGYEIILATKDHFGAVRSGYIRLEGYFLADYPQDQSTPPYINIHLTTYKTHFPTPNLSHKNAHGVRPTAPSQWICNFDVHPQKPEAREIGFKNIVFFRILKQLCW